MLDYEGPLQRLVVSRTLWLVVAWPLLGLVWQLTAARLRIDRARDATTRQRALGSARVAGLGCIALTVTATLGHALLLARLPPTSRALLEPIARGARFGELDAGLELLLDLRGLVACGLACVVVLAGGVVVATRPASDRGWRPWAWLQLALAGALVSFLGDGFVTVAFGWALAAAAGAWLAGWHDPGAGLVVGTRGAVALAALLVGGALLFWGLGGSWDDEGYTPEPRARLVAAHVDSGDGGPSLTMTGLAGALVYLDDARTSSLRAPFVQVPLAPGLHAIRVHPGDGTDEAVLARVEAVPGEEIALVPLGPTLSFHTMADELVLRDVVRDGRAPGPGVVRRAAEEHTAPGGFALIAGALLALLGAAGAMSGWSLPVSAPRTLTGVAAGVTTSALGPFLLVRVAFLFPSARHTGVVIAAVGAAIVLAALWHALGYADVRRWLVFAAGAPTGLTLVALGLGDIVAALGVMTVAGLMTAGFYLVMARRRGDAGEEATGAASLPERSPLDDALLARIPIRLGELLVSMERWVVDAVVSAAAATVQIAAWTVARADEHLVTTPADLAAVRLERAKSAVAPWIGVSLASVAWALLAVAGLVVLVHAAWPGG